MNCVTAPHSRVGEKVVGGDMENIVLVCLDERAGKDAIDNDASPVEPIGSNDTTRFLYVHLNAAK